MCSPGNSHTVMVWKLMAEHCGRQSTGTDIEHALLDKDGTPLKLVYVHVTSVYKNYICHRDTGQRTFAWFDETGKYKGRH